MKSALIVEDHPMFWLVEPLVRGFCGELYGTCPHGCPLRPEGLAGRAQAGVFALVDRGRCRTLVGEAQRAGLRNC